ncbi:capsular polysaccharide synthesis protein [Rhizobium hainanense]|uniref:Capsular polysaccharide synthesis protein n=1 Tax=Rhizobium hainanense TaxID=52131 RepID=A0A1C3ULU4_9HYPH|nr:capsular polysaccharide synthesis protein [Rhizobium hainanense]SCB16463.1 Capsular polysaccharide synthesis protein [Rhizobium hainanense]
MQRYWVQSMRRSADSARRMLAKQVAVAPFLPWDLRRKAIASHMKTASAQHLEARYAAIDYCMAVERPPQRQGQLGPIWQFWAQGVEKAPPLVQTCLRSVEMNACGRKRIVLTTDTVGDYLDLPGRVMDRIPFWGWTKFSNLLRLMLLARHGGTWIDATVLIDRAIPTWIEERDFFVFRWPYDPRILATWFMHARSETPLVVAINAAYQDYWLRAEKPGDYFMFHYLFEAVVLSQLRLSKLWKDVPFHSAATPHELQALLGHPFEYDLYRSILDRSWIQKLTHKFETTMPSSAPTFISRLSEGLPLAPPHLEG